jgi:hypothetical protein
VFKLGHRLLRHLDPAPSNEQLSGYQIEQPRGLGQDSSSRVGAQGHFGHPRGGDERTQQRMLFHGDGSLSMIPPQDPVKPELWDGRDIEKGEREMPNVTLVSA